MSYSFTLNGGYNVAEASVDAGTIYGAAAGAPYAVLIIPVNLVLRAPQAPPHWLYFRTLSCRLSAFDGCYSGDSRIAQLLLKVENGTQLTLETAYLEIPLDHHRLQLIEKKRVGDDCKLRLDCDLLVDEMIPVGAHESFGRKVPHLALVSSHKLTAQVHVHINKSHWGERVLPSLGFGKTYVIELPAMPLESVERFSKAFQALKNAQEFHREGRYNETVSKTRRALEELTEPEEYTDDKGVRRTRPLLKRVWQTRLGEATYKWINESIRILRRPGNDAVHGSGDNFSQFESQMLMMVATTMISYAAQHNLDGEPAPTEQ